jgi:hypothetical protein
MQYKQIQNTKLVVNIKQEKHIITKFQLMHLMLVKKTKINAPENDWIQCLNPEGTQDAQVIEKQTSTGQTRNMIKQLGKLKSNIISIFVK